MWYRHPFCRTDILAGLVLAILMSATAAHGIDSEYSRQSLKNIKAVHVLVEDLTESTRNAGFRKQNILKTTQRKLRLAGIHYLTQNQYLRVNGQPYLHVALSALHDRSAGNLIVYYLKLELVQNVLLERDVAILVDAPTWSIDKIGATYRIKQVQDELNDAIDRFVDAHRLANPEGPEKQQPLFSNPNR